MVLVIQGLFLTEERGAMAGIFNALLVCLKWCFLSFLHSHTEAVVVYQLVHFHVLCSTRMMGLSQGCSGLCLWEVAGVLSSVLKICYAKFVFHIS